MKNIKGVLQNSLCIFLSGGLREVNFKPQTLDQLLSTYYANMSKRLWIPSTWEVILDWVVLVCNPTSLLKGKPGASLVLMASKTSWIEELHPGLVTDSFSKY